MATHSVSERQKKPKILVAIDFGTTFSGIAWAQTGDKDEHNLIQRWPNETGPEAKSADKVPTTLKYNMISRNDEPRFKWGHQISSLEERHEWFKLHLEESRRSSPTLEWNFPPLTLQPIQTTFGRLSKTAEELSTDYLTALREHTEHMLSMSIPAKALKRIPREYIVTVPAVWTEKAQHLTSSCAIRAGMGTEATLHMVSEPEAAATYAFKAMNSCGLREGETFVLCDAGGGTVDLISYTVISLKPTLLIEEAAPGSGGECGSTFLNRIFEQFLNRKFKGDFDWDHEPQILAEAMEYFETTVKTSFNGTRGFWVPVNGVAAQQGMSRGRLELKISDLRGIFEPVIKKVLKLIDEQIQHTVEAVKLILLVGGLGGSPYLRKWIQNKFPSIEVTVAQNFDTAVVRGALLKGLAEIRGGGASNLPHIRSRKARKYYGTECLTQYVESVHSPKRKQRNSLAGEWSVPVLKWFVEKGMTVNESIPRPFGFKQMQLVSEGQPQQITIKIYCWDHSTDVPTYKTKDVTELGSVTADISKIDLDIETGEDNREYYVVDFDIEMTCHAAKTVFTTKYKDRPIGTPTQIEWA